MLKRLLVDTTEMAILGVFLVMVWIWANALSPGLTV
jgi:hypothetical protein